jgi:hypothetical protein
MDSPSVFLQNDIRLWRYHNHGNTPQMLAQGKTASVS